MKVSKGKYETSVINTICFPIIRQDFILPALRSLHEHTPPNYKSIVVNQSHSNPEFEQALYELSDLVIRPHVNYGFAQASNLAMRLAPTPYVTISNCDVLFLDNWWEGCMETFQRFPRAVGVAPMSPKEPGWGYGEPGYRYLIPPKPWHRRHMELAELHAQIKAGWKEIEDHQVRREILEKLKPIERELEPFVLKAAQDPQNIEALVKERKNQVIDGIAMWLVVWKREQFEEIGMFDERFFPGGGEDYCTCYRVYSRNWRALASSLSWCWHWWGQSKDERTGFDTALPPARPSWNKLSTKGFGEEGLYDPDVDVWGRSGVRTDPEVWRAPL